MPAGCPPGSRRSQRVRVISSMVFCLTKKECDLLDCARMILRDECPPDRRHYSCMASEDDTPDCTLCWSNYMDGIAGDIIELPKKGAAV